MKLPASLLFLIVFSLPGFTQEITDTETCMECHSDEELFGEANGEEYLAFINQELFESSVHSVMACVDCHEDIEDPFHDDELLPVDCAMCHEDQVLDMADSVHTPAVRNQCASCHGNAHYIVPRDHEESLLSKSAINIQCLQCHSSNSGIDGASIHPATSSFHLTLNTEENTEISCADCHGSHLVLPMESPDSLLSHTNAHKTCGECHTDALEDFESSIHGQTLLTGSGDTATCTQCHSEHTPESEMITQNPMQVYQTCGECHFDKDLMGQYGIETTGLEQLLQHSVHADEVRSGNPDAPDCADCHGYHDILALNNPESNVFFQNVAETCGKCHEEERDQFVISVHGVSSARGHKDSPVCTDCHGEHTILRTESEQSPVSKLNVAKSTCSRCHESVVLSDKYNINFGTVDSYYDSYHGLANKWGSQEAANCGSCHGVHMILPSSDPRSTISPARLAQTCGSCHPGMSDNVLLSPVHTSMDMTPFSLASWVQTIYIVLIVVVIGGMFLHNAVIYVSIVREKRKNDLQKPVYSRFNKFEIASHMILASSFIILTITGFALVFTESWWVQALTYFGFNEAVRSLLHRIAGVALMGISILYGFYMIFTKRGRSEVYSFAPAWKDVKDGFQNIGYYLGLCKSLPEYGRYDYTEKLEFWALVWGIIIMAVTGLILWFPVTALQFMPKWVIDISEMIHFYEAVLAGLAILIWHLFFVIYHPDEYPMNTAWIDGKMTIEKMKHRHPKELEQIESNITQEGPGDTSQNNG